MEFEHKSPGIYRSFDFTKLYLEKEQFWAENSGIDRFLILSNYPWKRSRFEPKTPGIDCFLDFTKFACEKEQFKPKPSSIYHSDLTFGLR